MPPKKKSGAKKRKPHRHMHGKGALSDAYNYVKDHHLVSGVLGLIPHPYAQGASVIARQAGLGRRKKMHGGGIFSDLGGGIGNVFGGIGSGVGSIAHGLFGSGRPMDHMRVNHLSL